MRTGPIASSEDRSGLFHEIDHVRRRQRRRHPRRALDVSELALRVFQMGAGGVEVVYAGDAARGFVVEED
jgi:hypothetical protein